MAPYKEWVHACTCTTKKRPCLKIEDQKNPRKFIRFGFSEPCPLTTFISIISRQCGTQITPDKDILTRYARFNEWMLTEIVAQMKREGVKIDANDNTQKE